MTPPSPLTDDDRRPPRPGSSEGEAFDRLRGVFDQVPAAIAYLRGPSHVFEFVNPSYVHLVSGRDVEGLTVDEALPEVREQGFIDLLDHVYATGERFVGNETRVTLLGPDGFEQVYVDFVYEPIRNHLEEIEGILCHAVDVTQAVRAREQLAEAARREQEDLFRHAVDTMIDTVIIAEPERDETGEVIDFMVSFVNMGRDEIGRRERDQLVGRRFTELWLNLADSELLERYIDVLETGEPLVLDEYVYREPAEEGERSGIFDIRATRLGTRLFLAFRDVTERINRERSLAESRRLLEREHEVAGILQAAILPREIPAVPGADIGARYMAASADLEVGGDWFDVLVLPDGRIALSVGDVAGNGIAAAQVMAQVRTAGRVAVLAGHAPEAVLAAQNSLMLVGGLGPFATTIYAIFDPRDRTFSWASAGHLPPLRAQAVTASFLLSSEQPPLGVIEAPRYESLQVELQPNDRIVLYTDGLVERRGESIVDGLERLRSACPRGGTAAATCEQLLTLLGVADGRSDDVCVVTLDVT